MGFQMTGHWARLQALTRGLDGRMKVAAREAAAEAGPILVAAVRDHMGRVQPALHPFTVARKGSSQPLVGGDLEAGVVWRSNQDGRVVWVGFSNPELAMRARVQERGITIAVTDAMRGYLHAEGLHLSLSTEAIVIPARPFLRPALAATRGRIKAIYREKIRARIRG